MALGRGHTDGGCSGAALVVAFLLSNLALRPLEEISRQLDYWTAASETGGAVEAASKQDTAARVSTKIDFIGQRMRKRGRGFFPH